MRLDSVRALKAEVADDIVAPLVEAGIASRSFGMEATSLARARDPIRAVALGIAAPGKSPDRDDFRLAVRLQRRALEPDGPLVSRIRERARGEVDIRYVGRITKQTPPWHQALQRPMLIGGSIAHHDVTAGTIGAFVHRKAEPGLYVLSNNHVLANEDFAREDDTVLQPGPADGGVDRRDRIGALAHWVKMRAAGNIVDAAIASVVSEVAVDRRTLTGLGMLAGMATRPLLPGDAVMKVGRTTGATRGRVTAIELDGVVIGYDRGSLSFDRQIEIEGAGDTAFSAGGDSGSLIVDADFGAVGLLFAGGDQGGSNGMGLTYANDLAAVLDALDIALAL